MKRYLLLKGKASRQMHSRLNQHFTLVDAQNIDDLSSFVQKHGEKVEAILTNGHDGTSAEEMQHFPNLKIIACNGVGYDAVDINSALQHKIVVTHTPDVLNKDVANTAIMMILAISRRLMRDGSWIAQGKWLAQGGPPLTESIEGAQVGILGLGRIGNTIAQKLQAFDCQISYHSRHKKEVPYHYFEDLAAMAEAVDYLIVIVPADKSTYHMVDEKIIRALGKTGTLVNIARGSVVDEKALIAALQSGVLGAAALDVFEHEPKVPTALFNLDNVLLLPHVGSATVSTRKAMGNLAVDNLIDYFSKGKVRTPVPECRGVKIRQ